MSRIHDKMSTAGRARAFQLTIDAGFVHTRAINAVLDESGQVRLDGIIRRMPGSLPDHLRDERLRWAYTSVLLYFCRAHNVPTLGALLAAGSGSLFCSTETLARARGLSKRGLVTSQVRSKGKVDRKVVLEYTTDHFCATSVRAKLIEGGIFSIIAQFDREEDDTLTFRPLIIGFPTLTSDNPDWAEAGMWWGYNFYEHFVQDFAELARVVDLPRPKTFERMQDIEERAFKECLAELLGDATANDWGGELSDHFTANLHLEGRRVSAAFLLKGPSAFRPMTLNHLGKNNDQIYRLSLEPAEVLFVQHSHEITQPVRATLRAFAVQPGHPRRYCFIDGRDSLWLLKAYKLLPRALEISKRLRSERRARPAG